MIIIREQFTMHKFKLFGTFFLIITLTGCASLQMQSVTTPTTNSTPTATVSSASTATTSTTPVQTTTAATPDNTANTNNSSNTSNNDEPIQTPGETVDGQYTSLWDVIRVGFTLNHYYDNPTVQYWVNFYTKDPNLIENIAVQATPYLYFIVDQIQERNIPTEIALLPIVESGFQPKGRSWCGALGLWQLMPQTARDLDTGEENRFYNARESIDDSTTAALNYLKYLYNYFNGDWMLALAAYNSGPGTVQNAMGYNSARGRPTDFWDLRLPSQTESYVPKLLALAIIINDPARYNITLPPIPNHPLIGTATIPQQMSLAQAAKFAGINEDELKELNPAFTRNVTPPKYLGTYTLNLPISKVETFEENCAANPGVTGLERYTLATANASGYGTYKVHRGDTLDAVSRFTGVSVATLESYNHLHNSALFAGQVLHYPIDTTAAYQYITYTVRPGDTLSSIALRYHVSLFYLMQWNDLKSQLIHVGERLVIRQKISY